MGNLVGKTAQNVCHVFKYEAVYFADQMTLREMVGIVEKIMEKLENSPVTLISFGGLPDYFL